MQTVATWRKVSLLIKCLAIKWKELTRTAPAVVVRHLWNFGSCVAVKGVVLISCVCCRLVCLFLRDQWIMLSCCTNCGHLLCWWTCCVEWNVWSDVTDSYHPRRMRTCTFTSVLFIDMQPSLWHSGTIHRDLQPPKCLLWSKVLFV